MAILAPSFSPEAVGQAGDFMQKLQDVGVPAFIALERGARALRNALDYHSFNSSASS